MKLLIKQCKYCPLMPDCEYRKLLKTETRKALPNVTVVHSCPEYRKLFKEGDEVMMRPIFLSVMDSDGTPEYKYIPHAETFRGVVINVPLNSKNNHYGVALFEPVSLSNDAANPKIRYIIGVKADQLVKTGVYKGYAFWESDEYLTN